MPSMPPLEATRDVTRRLESTVQPFHTGSPPGFSSVRIFFHFPASGGVCSAFASVSGLIDTPCLAEMPCSAAPLRFPSACLFAASLQPTPCLRTRTRIHTPERLAQMCPLAPTGDVSDSPPAPGPGPAYGYAVLAVLSRMYDADYHVYLYCPEQRDMRRQASTHLHGLCPCLGTARYGSVDSACALITLDTFSPTPCCSIVRTLSLALHTVCARNWVKVVCWVPTSWTAKHTGLPRHNHLI